jgi:hypothetical protein
MAFNIIAETSHQLPFELIHSEIYSDDKLFDFIPMPGLGVNGGDAIGLLIPSKSINELSWAQLKPILKILRTNYKCDVYDLYGGQKLTLFNIAMFKKNFFLK